MKILWLSHFIPYPPKGGAHQRSYHLLRNIASRHEVALVAFNRPAVPPDYLAECGAALRRFCAEVEFWDLPVPWMSLRWWARLGLSPLYRLPYACLSYGSKDIAQRWQAALRRHSQAILHIDSSDLALFADAAQGRVIVLNHHNCESAMTLRRAQLESNLLKKTYLAHQGHKQARLEARLCGQVAANTVVSAEDGDLLRRECPGAHIHVVENGTDTSYFTPNPTAVEPNSVVFAGSLNWYPNWSAIRFFARDIWPLVKAKSPGVRFYLAGQKPAEWIVQWAGGDPQVTLVPSPDDIRPWIAKGAAFICPIQDGGGTRLKILDAMAMGKAVVSTTVGCEGLRVQPGVNILVADKPEALADELLKVVADSDLRSQLSSAARLLVEDQYSWERIAQHLEGAYRCASGEKCPLHCSPS